MSQLSSFRSISLARLAPQSARSPLASRLVQSRSLHGMLSRSLPVVESMKANQRMKSGSVAPSVVLPLSRPFSVSASALNRAPSENILDVVNSELKIAEAVTNELTPKYGEFLNENGYEIVHNPNTVNVQLARTLKSGERVQIFFRIDDVAEVPPFPETAEEPQDEFEEQQLDQSFASVHILVLNPARNDGLLFELLLQSSEELFFVQNFLYKPDVTSYLKQVEKGEFSDLDAYQGPEMGNLDESLQLMVEDYLKVRGVNESLAEFIFEYSDIAEETCYRDWLKDVAKYLQK